MCGIVGIITTTLDRQGVRSDPTTAEGAQAPNDMDCCAQMTRALAHRGPDAESCFKEYIGQSLVELGHRRLAILDLSPAGNQPMIREELVIVFNGEIYNYLELREQLKDEFDFKTGTDTEVILAAYKKWGSECVRYFNGDWAFCLVDRRTGIAFLSRDRYGIKPLFYVATTKLFGFASEISALRLLNGIGLNINQRVVAEFLFGGLLDFGRETSFEGIYNVLPGENLCIDLNSGQLKRWKYYNLPIGSERAEYTQALAQSKAEELRELLLDSVKIRLRADVPVGACLSGGLDSSSIVACISKLLGRGSSFHTFTAVFPGQALDERRFAERVARYVGATTHFIQPTEQECRQLLDDVVVTQGEPYGGPSVYSQHVVMREAGRFVKVVLDGQGGDEVLAGYRVHRSAYFAELLRSGHWLDFLRELLGLFRNTRSELSTLKHMLFYCLPVAAKEFLFSRTKIRSLTSHEWQSVSLQLNKAARNERMHRAFAPVLRDMLTFMLEVGSLPHLLRFEDRNSMCFSIESRVPFTDYRLVDFAASLPSNYFIRDGWTKYILRLAMREMLPADIIWRKDKLGFATPAWLNHADLAKLWAQAHFPVCQRS